MQIDDTTLLWLLKESIRVMEEVIEISKTRLGYANDNKYLCYILSDILSEGSNTPSHEYHDFFNDLVSPRMNNFYTFGEYLEEVDLLFENLNYAEGEDSIEALTYEMQKKIEFVKDWIKELEAKEAV